jgi:hypothetical protein
MIPKFHPAVFLGAVILLCAVWLWQRPPMAAVAMPTRSTPRPAVVEPASIALDMAILERYVGKYEGRSGFTIDLALKDGKLIVQSVVPYELRATSETEFFVMLNAPIGVDVKFDVARDGTVRGFSANTEYGLIEAKRVR